MHAWGAVIVCRNDGWRRFSLAARGDKKSNGRQTDRREDGPADGAANGKRSFQKWGRSVSEEDLIFLESLSDGCCLPSVKSEVRGQTGVKIVTSDLRHAAELSIDSSWLSVLKQFGSRNYDVKWKAFIFLVHLLKNSGSFSMLLQQNVSLMLCDWFYHPHDDATPYQMDKWEVFSDFEDQMRKKL